MDSQFKQAMKKDATLEGFCRGNSEQLNYSSVRYYEKCIIDKNGQGILSLCYVILTSDSLFLTQKSPSSFTHNIPLGQIKDINLVADRESVFKPGRDSNSSFCQHVRISYDQISKSKDQQRKNNTRGPALNGVLRNDTEQRRIDTQVSSLTHIPLSIQRAFDPAFDYDFEREPSSSYSSSKFSPGLFRRYGRSLIANKLGSETDSIQTDETRTTTKLSSGSESPFRSSSVIEEKLYFWRTGNKKEEIKSKRPSSVDISQLAKLGKIFGRKTTKSNSKSKDNEEYSSDTERSHRKSKSTHQEMNLYFYKPGSVFLNEICMYWNRQLLKQPVENNDMSTLRLQSAGKPSNSIPRDNNSDLYLAEVVFQRLRNDEASGIQILFNKKSIKYFQTVGDSGKDAISYKIFPVLQLLHRAMLKYEGLAHFCLKSSKLLTNLEVLLKYSLITAKGTKNEEVFGRSVQEEQKFVKYRIQTLNGNGQRNNKDFQLVVDKISMHVILMDIFRLLLLRSSENNQLQFTGSFDGGPGALISQDVNNNWQATGFNTGSQVLEVTLYSIFAFPCLFEFDYNLKVLVLNSGLDLNRDITKNYELIRLLSMSHNISTAILYDILICAQYSPKDTAKRNVQILLNAFNLLPYIRQSMAQLINLFCSAQEMLSFAQCTLLHRQLIVLSHLIQHKHTVIGYLRNQYCEEFRYFLNCESLNLKVPEQYPNKTKLTHALGTLRSLVIK